MDSYFLDETNGIDEEKLDLGRYYRVLLKRWWLVLLITVVVTVPWVIYLKKQPPVYEAEALIRFTSFGGFDPALLESRMTELTSRSFAERVVAQLGLAMRFTDEGKLLTRRDVFDTFSTTQNPVTGNYILHLSDRQTYKLSLVLEEGREKTLRSGYINEITDSLTTINGFSFKLAWNGITPPQDIPFKISSFRKSVKRFQDRTQVDIHRSGNLMSLKLIDDDPYLVTQMTNRLAEIFVEESASVKKRSIEDRRKLLEDQLRITEKKLNASENKLKAFKERNSVDLDAENKKQLNDVVSYGRQRDKITNLINALNTLLSKLQSEKLAVNANSDSESEIRYIMREIAANSAFENDPSMLVIRNQLADLEKSYDTVVSRTSKSNFKAKELMAKIKDLHVQIESLADQKTQILQNDLAVVETSINQLNYELSRLPGLQKEFSELKRENDVLADQYKNLLAKTRDIQMTEQVETEKVEILDPAIEPELPVNNDKKKNAAFGGILGLMLGIGVTLLIEFFDKSIKTVDDIKKYLKLRVLGTIPQIDFSDVFDFQDSEKVKQIDQQLVTHDYSPTPIGEAYRSLRTNLLFSKETGRIQSLVITSNEPGDGKSFTAANLSITFAQLKSNSLLIDTDLRRGVLHNTFGVPKEPGFSNYLTNMVPLQSILRETHIPNLTLISCGSLIPNPSELLGSHQMRRFIDEVRRKYDLIVFDSPPLNAATDAVVIGTQVDGTVVVIRAAKTNRDLARQKLELFTNVPAKLLGVIFNGTTADMAHPGYSYYHY
ncbi:MAG: GumC family protein [bacterium]